MRDAFFATAAQVIPVLLLVLAFELRVFAMADNRSDRIVGGGLMLFVIAAEASSLAYLFYHPASTGVQTLLASLTATGLAAAFSLVGVIALFLPARRPKGGADS